jgi:hypothetical protein
MPRRNDAHQQGGQPRAVFYFVLEDPMLLTGVAALQLAWHYFRLARSEAPGRFNRFLAFVEEDRRMPEQVRRVPSHDRSMPGRVVRIMRHPVRETLATKRRHEAEHLRRPGTPSVRPPSYYQQELCVIYIGSLAFLLLNARLNLEETGVLRKKYLDFTIEAADLITHSRSAAEQDLPSSERRDSHAHIDCYDAENFYLGNFDEFAQAIGLKRRGPRILSHKQAMRRLGIFERESN